MRSKGNHFETFRHEDGEFRYLGSYATAVDAAVRFARYMQDEAPVKPLRQKSAAEREREDEERPRQRLREEEAQALKALNQAKAVAAAAFGESGSAEGDNDTRNNDTLEAAREVLLPVYRARKRQIEHMLRTRTSLRCVDIQGVALERSRPTSALTRHAAVSRNGSDS